MVTSDAVTGRPIRDGTYWRDLTLQSDSTRRGSLRGRPGEWYSTLRAAPARRAPSRRELVGPPNNQSREGRLTAHKLKNHRKTEKWRRVCLTLPKRSPAIIGPT